MTLTETEKLISWFNNQTLANLSNNISLECEGEEKQILAKYRVLLSNRLDDILKKIVGEKSVYDNARYIKIFNSLREWMTKRRLNYQDQLANIVGNVLEEMTEIARAKDDMHERIDGLIDICVFCINASEKPIDICRFNGLEGITLDSVPQFIDFSNLVMNNIETPQEIVPICFAIIENLGYEPFECMFEVIKELNSRTGHYDESIGKFVKDLGFYSLKECQETYPNYKVTEETNRFKLDLGDEIQYRPKWHKANYSKCKLGE